MRRYTQEKLRYMSHSAFIKLIESGACTVDEKRVIRKETYPARFRWDKPYDIYVVVFYYTLTFPETWLFEREVYDVEIEDRISFKEQKSAEEYIENVQYPSSSYSESYSEKRLIWLKKDYLDKIKQVCGDAIITLYADISIVENERRKVLDTYFLTLNDRHCACDFRLSGIIKDVQCQYGAPTSITDVVEVIEKKYNVVNLDEMIADVEKLKNEKNKLIADEIQRQTEYILTLKKLL